METAGWYLSEAPMCRYCAVLQTAEKINRQEQIQEVMKKGRKKGENEGGNIQTKEVRMEGRNKDRKEVKKKVIVGYFNRRSNR
jgi:hypothetical protein